MCESKFWCETMASDPKFKKVEIIIINYCTYWILSLFSIKLWVKRMSPKWGPRLSECICKLKLKKQTFLRTCLIFPDVLPTSYFQELWCEMCLWDLRRDVIDVQFTTAFLFPGTEHSVRDPGWFLYKWIRNETSSALPVLLIWSQKDVFCFFWSNKTLLQIDKWLRTMKH